MPSIKSGVSFEGDDKIMKALSDFIIDVNSEAGGILTEAAEMLAAEAKKLAPVSKAGETKGKYAHPPGTLRDSIKVGTVRKGKYRISQAVGIAANKYFTQGNDNLWYARWVEFGTKERTVKNSWGRKGVSHSSGVMLASPFMRPAVVKTRRKINNHVRNRLKEELFND